MIQRTQKDKGVSAVIGVILMVILAIILAAVISQFTLELGDLLQEPVQAGITFDESYNANTDTYDVEVVWSTGGTVEEIHVIEPDGSISPTMTNVGEDIEVTNIDEGDSIRVIGTLDDGSEGVLQEYEVG